MIRKGERAEECNQSEWRMIDAMKDDEADSVECKFINTVC